MRNLKVLAAVAVLAAVLLVWGVALATSDPAPALRNSTAVGQLTGRLAQTVVPNGPAPAHTGPARTYFSSGVSFSPIESSPEAFGTPISVTCPGTSGRCKIEIDNDLQVGGNATKGAYVGMWEVRDDSVQSSPGGTYQLVSPDGSYNTVSFVELLTGVNHGTHSIQPMVMTTGAGMTAYNYTIIVRVYKP